MKNPFNSIFFKIVLLFSLIPVMANAQIHTAGPNYSGAVTAENNTGEILFTSLSRAAGAPNNHFMVASGNIVIGTNYTNTILFTGFNFNIPAHGIITGIEVVVTKRASINNFLVGVYDNVVQLYYNNAKLGTNKASNSKWGTSRFSASYDGNMEDWGVTLTPNMVNSPDFGIAFQAMVTGIAGSHTVYLDAISVRISYITSVLPAVLKSFEVNAEGALPEIAWEVEADAPGEMLRIEHAADNMNFKTIFETELLKSTVNKAKFLHQPAHSGVHYYRLQLIKNDEVLWVSAIKSFRFTPHQQFPYPNPVEGLLYIPGETHQIRVYNSGGMQVNLKSFRQGNAMVADFSLLPMGTYYIKTSTSVFTIIKK